MPLLNTPDMEDKNIGGTNYGFSAVKIGDLGASEYTLVVIASDVSASTASFVQAHTDCLKEIVRACRSSPRADNLLLRLVTFDNRVNEVHGFKPLAECNPDDYDGAIRIGGMTALFDATYNGVQSVLQYGKDLVDQDFMANAIVFVITDGMDNRSTMTPGSIKQSVADAVHSEALESIRTVLIGLETQGQPQLQAYLTSFERDGGFDQYVEAGAADEGNLAKLARFVSASISSASQSLGSGGPSQSLGF